LKRTVCTPVIALTTVDFPWATCPIVPARMCGGPGSGLCLLRALAPSCTFCVKSASRVCDKLNRSQQRGAWPSPLVPSLVCCCGQVRAWPVIIAVLASSVALSMCRRCPQVAGAANANSTRGLPAIASQSER
jgi:hypothetical protein